MAADIARAAALAAAFGARFEGLLRAYVVVAGEGEAPADAPVIHDPEGALHATYGAAEPGLYLFRPDNRVAFRAQPPALVPLRSFLDGVLSCATLAAPATAPR